MNTEPRIEDFDTFNDFYGNWQAWFNSMVGTNQKEMK